MKQDFAQFKAASDKSLPESLPPGERIIWQGKPSVKGLALRAFHVREVVLYFGVVLAWRLWSNASAGMPAPDALISASWLVVPAIASIATLTLLAWLFARAACYTLTNKRVLFQFGVALPLTMNIPLNKIVNASLKTYSDGSGDIPLTLSDDRGAWALLWPHVRPWKLRAAEPMLRAIPDAANVAAKLAVALTGEPASSTLAANTNAGLRATAMPTATPAAA